MSDRPVNLSTGLPETVIDAEPADALDRLQGVEATDDDRGAVAAVLADHPRCLLGWAMLSERGRDPIERYAAARVGYHRGLDRLRASGWRGSGYVRWSHAENRGFLRCLWLLQQAAAEIGETEEVDRCAQFLRQLDPTWPPADLEV